jgi:lysine 2,3-aminomutase
VNTRISSREWQAHERAFRRRVFPHASTADWRDWRWQMANRLQTKEAVAHSLALSGRERAALASPHRWRMPLAITPYYAALLELEPPDGPLRRTVLPDEREGTHGAGEQMDPLGEEAHQATAHVVRSYPHKALLLVTTECACFCRYCTRARRARRGTPTDLAPALAFLRAESGIQDVLISGGDPLVLGNEVLGDLLQQLRDIPHVDFLRLGSKVPAVLPQRITHELPRLFKRFRPLWISTHFTHPMELTPPVAKACARLSEAGIPLMNQTVLLRGINDTAETLRELNEGLLRIGVKPYYLHQGDMAAGTAHLRSSIRRGRCILKALCGNTTGYAIPHFMLDQPGGGGKIPL